MDHRIHETITRTGMGYNRTERPLRGVFTCREWIYEPEDLKAFIRRSEGLGLIDYKMLRKTLKEDGRVEVEWDE